MCSSDLVRPERTEVEYGYLVPGARVGGVGDAFRVATFHEKPTPEAAAEIIRRGGLWNSFVMVGRVARFLELLRDRRPGDVALLAGGLPGAYDAIEGWNFSRDFLAHVAPHLVVARADDLGWSDWGTEDAIERTLVGLGITPPWRAPLRATA